LRTIDTLTNKGTCTNEENLPEIDSPKKEPCTVKIGEF